MQEELSLFKADVDSAYRRVPIKQQHREFSAVVFKYKGQVLISVHYCLPFGATAAVFGWDREGSVPAPRAIPPPAVLSYLLCRCAPQPPHS